MDGDMGINDDRAIWKAETNGIELLKETIGELLDRQAAAFPDHEALVYNYPESGLNIRFSYRQYCEAADQIAKGLLALGIEKGEHIAVWASNVPEWPLLEMALAKIGAVLVTINTNYRASELEYVLRQGDITTLFMIEGFRGNSYLDTIYGVLPELKILADPIHDPVRSSGLPRLTRVVLIGGQPAPGLIPYSQVLALGESITDRALARRQQSVSPGDVAQIQYTSGTTGFPKGAALSHHNIVNNVFLFTSRANLTSSDRYVTGMPFFHTAGCVLGVLATLVTASTLIPLIAFDPVKELELIAAEKATFALNVPTMFAAILNHPRFLAREFDTSSLRHVGCGGSPVPLALMEQVKAQMGADTWIAYGLTEASPLITQALPGDRFELRAATVGLPLPHTDVKIINPATGDPALLGQPGELMTRGYLVMKGYYQMPEKTAESIDADGWLRTGDLATMNPEGYINIVGRVKDMIIRGGENLFPAEIESFLMRHPKVAEAQVVGVPDSLMVEEAVAVLRLRPETRADEDEIREYCRNGISRHKVPKYIKFVTEFPLTASGKVKKFELRAQLIRELGLEKLHAMRTA
jgi:fatty-acyl-CoA synthase